MYAAPSASNNPNSLRTFLIMWIGQTASAIGSGLTLFSLMWWVWITYKSGTAIAGVELAMAAAPIFLGPIAGAYVDRLDRRKIILTMLDYPAKRF